MPDAPAPVRNAAGTIVASWTARLGYDDVGDEVTLTFDRAGSEWAGPLHLELRWPPSEVDEALAALCRFSRAASAVRLF